MGPKNFVFAVELILTNYFSGATCEDNDGCTGDGQMCEDVAGSKTCKCNTDTHKEDNDKCVVKTAVGKLDPASNGKMI